MTRRGNQSAASRTSVRVAIGLGALALVMVVAFYGVTSYLFRKAPGSPTEPPILVVIERGWGLSRIASELQHAGAIADRTGFILLARQSGVGNRLQAGEYAIARGQGPAAVIDMLVHHRTLKRRFTVVPGNTAAQIVAKLAAAGLDPKGQAAKLIRDRKFIAKLGVDAPTLEGYLYPETYLYERGDDAREMLGRMVQQFFAVWNSRFADRAKKSTLTAREILTLASIVEKESGLSLERPKIARVFLNRLQLGMRLQADPTVIYALGDQFTGNLTEADLRRDHPYNTYTRKNLPPGPICSPGADAIAAVLSPADGPWQYFVADGHGQHVFSTTLEEHNRAVQSLQP